MSRAKQNSFKKKSIYSQKFSPGKNNVTFEEDLISRNRKRNFAQ